MMTWFKRIKGHKGPKIAPRRLGTVKKLLVTQKLGAKGVKDQTTIFAMN